MTLSTDIADFTRRDISLEGKTKPVLTIGAAGPAVIVMHEVFGFTPTLARLCRWFAEAEFRVYAPILFGSPDARNAERIETTRVVSLCISREFTMLAANRSSPVTDWLRQLAHLAHDECGGPGVGAIGLCLTGGFALSMAIDPVIVAPVLGEPSLPAMSPAALDIAPDALARVKARTRTDGLTIRGYRFEGDGLCKPQRFTTLRTELGAAFSGTELPDACGNPGGMRSQGKPPHSVFTVDLIDAPGERTRAAVDEVIAFFREKLGAAPPAHALPPGVEQGV
jgi:dienelactone hydrolase